MSIAYYTFPAKDGNPDGLIDGPAGTQFIKEGRFYKLNYSGSVASGWLDVNFIPTPIPDYFKTDADNVISAESTGSFLYVKTSPIGTPYGWKLLSNKSPFIRT